VYAASYGYLANSDLLDTTAYKQSGVTKLTTSRIWDFGARLRSISSVAGSSTISSRNYDYDSLNRKIRGTQEDFSTWNFEYDDRDEVVSGRKIWGDSSPVSGFQFTYAFDNIGNRIFHSSGGDVDGLTLRTTTYTANNLNQYTGITTPGYEDISGQAWVSATVTVNAAATDRKGEYFHKEISIANSGGPVWQNVNITNGATFTNTSLAFPKNVQSLSYDLDGNLTFDGIWAYEWDAENRLKAMSMTNLTGIPNTSRRKLEFSYDYQGRRATKKVSSWNGGSYVSPSTSKFVYDNWNLVAEVGPSGTVLRSYLWGQDIVGSLPGESGEGSAAGIGALLLVVDNVAGTYHFPTFDANGNVTALINSADQSVSARYEYSPFGETLRATGIQARNNPFRFSTKFADDESDLIHYGYRLYSPSMGRWISRDPIDEQDGNNLYAFTHNDSINLFDRLGTTSGSAIDNEGAMAEGEGLGGGSGGQAVRQLGNVREWADGMNDFQEIFNLVLDAAEGDPSDILQKLWNARQEVMNMNKSGPTSQHHVFTQQFGKLMKEAGINTDKFTAGISQLIHRKLHSGKGFGRGGMWNWLWKHYTGGKKGADMKVEDIKKFERQVSKFFGIDDVPLIPYLSLCVI